MRAVSGSKRAAATVRQSLRQTSPTMTKMLLPWLMLAALTPAAHAQDAEAGRAKAAMCIGCHGIPGYQNAFPEVHKVPMISGQAGGYLAAALQAYRSGERRHPTMRGIARALSDADIADLAAFYERDGAAGLQLKSVAARQPSARQTHEPPRQGGGRAQRRFSCKRSQVA